MKMITISFEKNPLEKDSFFLLINGVKATHTCKSGRMIFNGKYLNNETLTFNIKVSGAEKNEALKVLQADGEEYPFRIKKFTYNGFFGQEYKSYIKQKGRFLRWSGDPGIAVMLLDNGKELLVPTYAIPGSCIIPRDESYSKGILFGVASKA